MIYSKYLLSLSMFALAFLSLLKFKIGIRQFDIGVDTSALGRLLTIHRHPSFAVISLFFFVVLLSFWQVDDYQFFRSRLRIKLPFLLMPLLFLALPKFSSRQLNGLLYVLLIILVLTATGIGINYLFNAEAITLSMKEGHPMPTPGNHIRFSLLLALGILGGVFLYYNRFYWRFPQERFWIGAGTLLLFFFLHFLSVRTGLIALYTTLFVLLIRYIITAKQYFLGSILMLGLTAIPVVSYCLLPSFKAKVDYMRWDFLMHEENKGANYADSGRMVSLQVGWELWKKHPVFGVGAGNLRSEVERVFKEKYPQYEVALKPHNQFLYVAAGSGIIGLTLFVFAFFSPFFYKKNYKHVEFIAFYSIIFTAFLLEHTIENAVGVAFFVFFLLLLLNHYNRR